MARNSNRFCHRIRAVLTAQINLRLQHVIRPSVESAQRRIITVNNAVWPFGSDMRPYVQLKTRFADWFFSYSSRSPSSSRYLPCSSRYAPNFSIFLPSNCWVRRPRASNSRWRPRGSFPQDLSKLHVRDLPQAPLPTRRRRRPPPRRQWLPLLSRHHTSLLPFLASLHRLLRSRRLPARRKTRRVPRLSSCLFWSRKSAVYIMYSACKVACCYQSRMQPRVYSHRGDKEQLTPRHCPKSCHRQQLGHTDRSHRDWPLSSCRCPSRTQPYRVLQLEFSYKELLVEDQIPSMHRL